MPPVRTTCTLTRQLPHMLRMATCTHTHTRCPQTHVRHTLHSAPLIPSTCPEDPWAPAVRGEDLIFFFFNHCGHFASHSVFGPQWSRIVEKVYLGPIPGTGRDGARDCVISVVGGEAHDGLPGIRHDCIPQPGCLGPNVHAASSVHAHQIPLPFEPSSFLPLEYYFPLSLPIEIFPFPWYLAQAPSPLKRPAGNDLSHFNSSRLYFLWHSLLPDYTLPLGVWVFFCLWV